VLSLVIAAVLFGGVFWKLSDHFLGEQFRATELQIVQDDHSRLDHAVDDQLQSYSRMAMDYSHWHDSWEFIKTQSPSYSKVNLTWDGLANLGVNHFLFLDLRGRLVAHYGIDLLSKTKDTLPVPLKLLASLAVHSDMFLAAKDSSASWIETIDATTWLMAASAITPDQSSKECDGYFIVARMLDDEMIKRFSERIRLPLRKVSVQEIPPGTAQINGGMLRIDAATHQSVAYFPLGSRGQAWVELRRDRQVERSGRASVFFLSISLGISGVLLLMLLLALLDKSVVFPLHRIQQKFKLIGSSGDFATRLEIRGPQEVRSLTIGMNSVLQTLDDALKHLGAVEQEQRMMADELRTTHLFMTKLVDYLPDATFAVDIHGCVMAWNHSMEVLMGVQADMMIGQNLSRVALKFYGTERRLLLESFFHPELGTETFPERVLQANGVYQFEEFITQKDSSHGRFYDQTATGLRDAKGVFLGALQTIRDVTDHKRAEMRLEFLSLHDPLTGLFNRTYFAEASTGFGTAANLPLGVVLIDLDGLKLVNDTLGHEHGDALILAAAGLMRKAFPNLPIARIGGDEFTIFFSRTPEDDMRKAVDRFQEFIEEHNASAPPMPVQLSLGFAWSDHSPVIADLVKEADARMYREKDLRRETVRIGYVTNLQRRFEELHRKDSDSTQRLTALTERFAQSLSVPRADLEKLLLLARYRDIGKVGISERVMLKPGSLDNEEQDELRKQPEIGYRIAKISRELAPIAENILKHREWWDGRGYPLGLAGEQIPYLNRILAVVETYIAMTGPRVRSRSVSVDGALEEIQMMSGKKLDPKIVVAFGTFLKQLG